MRDIDRQTGKSSTKNKSKSAGGIWVIVNDNDEIVVSDAQTKKVQAYSLNGKLLREFIPPGGSAGKWQK